MGLENERHESKNYVTLTAGKFCLKVKEGTDGAVDRINKNGKKVWELKYNKLSFVMVKKIEKTIGDYGAQWEFTLSDGPDTYILTLPYSNKATNGILFRLPNIDFSKPITLKVHYFTEDENGSTLEFPNTFITVEQDGKKVDAAYTTENPNGLPDKEEVMRKGKPEKDDTKRMLFIEAMIANDIQPKLRTGGIDPTAFAEPDAHDTEDEFPLPF